MKNLKRVLAVLVLVLLFTSCADVSTCVTETPEYGFWSGIWHGFTIGFSFIGSLFSDDIAIYAVDNTGGWYDLGFWFGLGGLSTIFKRL